jgi:hypothetical protein
MPFPLFPLALTGLSALAGALASRRKSRVSRTEGFDVTQEPVIPPILQQGQRFLVNELLNRISQPLDLTGYRGSGISNINRSFDLRNEALKNILASRGLSFSPVAANALANAETQRLQAIADFVNQLPLLSRQLQTGDLTLLAQFLPTIPTGVRRFGTTTANQLGFESGSPIGGLASGAGQALAFLKALGVI